MTSGHTPLYSDISHTLARIVAGSFLAFVSLGIAVGARDLLSRPTPGSFAAVAAFSAITFGAVRMLTRTQRIFGTAEGLVAKSAKATRTIPWSLVGEVECPLSSFNPVFRRYYVTVLGEETRIYFFAGRREIERLEHFRAT